MTLLLGKMLSVKSNEPWYSLEQDGVKSATIRLMSDDELQEARMASTIRVVNYESVKPKMFERTITGVYDVTGYIKPHGSGHVVLICWEHAGGAKVE